MIFPLLLFWPDARFIPAGHALIGQHVAVTSSAFTMAGADTHAASDPTMFFITIVVGITVLVLIWLMRRSQAQGGDTRDKSGECRVLWREFRYLCPLLGSGVLVTCTSCSSLTLNCAPCVLVSLDYPLPLWYLVEMHPGSVTLNLTHYFLCISLSRHNIFFPPFFSPCFPLLISPFPFGP